MEEYKPVKDYEGLYEISSLGNIVHISKVNKLRRRLKPRKNRRGYLQLILSKNAIPKTKLLHRLVAEVFLPRIEDLNEVNHLDGDKTNNRLENLEWSNHSLNTLHAFKIGLMKPRDKLGLTLKKYNKENRRLTDEQVDYIRMNYIKGSKEFGVRPLSRKFDISRCVIIGIIRKTMYIN